MVLVNHRHLPITHTLQWFLGNGGSFDVLELYLKKLKVFLLKMYSLNMVLPFYYHSYLCRDKLWLEEKVLVKDSG